MLVCEKSHWILTSAFSIGCVKRFSEYNLKELVKNLDQKCRDAGKVQGSSSISSLVKEHLIFVLCMSLARYLDMHCSKLSRIFYCNVSMMLWSPFSCLMVITASSKRCNKRFWTILSKACPNIELVYHNHCYYDPQVVHTFVCQLLCFIPCCIYFYQSSYCSMWHAGV